MEYYCEQYHEALAIEAFVGDALLVRTEGRGDGVSVYHRFDCSRFSRELNVLNERHVEEDWDEAWEMTDEEDLDEELQTLEYWMQENHGYESPNDDGDDESFDLLQWDDGSVEDEGLGDEGLEDEEDWMVVDDDDDDTF